MLQLDMVTHFTKTATPEIRASLAPAMALARATATHIRRRLIKGRTATRGKAYSADPRAGPRKRRRYYISPAYAAEAKTTKTSWKSSVDMHQAVRASYGNVTGALLRSMRVRNYGRDAVVIEFAGSSLGASSVRTATTKRVKGEYEVTLSDSGAVRAKQVRELARDSEGIVKRRRKPKLVRNSHKASAVFTATKIGLLQPTDEESRAQLAAITDIYTGILITSFGGVVIQEDGVKGDRRLYDAIKRELR